MISIIAGKYKGRKLSYFNNDIVRPTQAKVRKSVFDILGPLDGMKVLDLYSGIGSLGIESLSRGAVHLTAVEKDSKVFKILLNNINKVCKSDDVKLYRKDVNQFLRMNTQKFDIIFADPPYDDLNFFDIKESISNFLNDKGVFCMEMKRTKTIEFDNDIRIKKYGSTQVAFWILN
jgi:16S rRNA (guanine966-N2)-methyltransferase